MPRSRAQRGLEKVDQEKREQHGHRIDPSRRLGLSFRARVWWGQLGAAVVTRAVDVEFPLRRRIGRIGGRARPWEMEDFNKDQRLAYMKKVVFQDEDVHA
jgi:hypothetical protein